MPKNTITPETAGIIARKIGIVSKSDSDWLEYALEAFASGATVAEAVAFILAQKNKDRKV